MRTLLLLFVFALTIKTGYSEECETIRYKEKIFDEIEIIEDIQYGSNLNNINKEQSLYLDVFMPSLNQDTLKRRPVVLLFHGGSFVGGSRKVSTIRFMANELARRGYVAIPVQYRLEQVAGNGEPILNFANKIKWYKAILRGAQDIKGSIRYLKYTVAQEGNPYGIDTSNFTLYGSSAGAIGILHATYLDDSDEINLAWTNAVNDLGGLEGNTSTHLQYGSVNTVKNLIVDSGALFEKDWIGDKNDVAVLSAHHNQDPTVPFGHGCFYVGFCHLGQHYGPLQYVPVLQENGSRVEQYVVQGAAHPVDDLNRELALEKTVNFLYESQCQYVPEDPIPTSIRSNTLTELKVYPNPNSGIFTVQSSELSGVDKLQLYSVSGQLMQEIRLTNLSQQIELDYPNGMYFMTLSNPQGVKGMTKITISR